MSSPLKQNTTTIQNLLNTINSLPDAGTDLPELSNEGSAVELFAGKELIDGNGEKVTGTFTIDSELSTQDSLITQIQTALQNKTSASEPVLQTKTVTPTTSAQNVTPDSGYDGLSKVTVNAMPTATQATPSISVNSSGLITASATQTAGYVTAGTKSATKQLTTQAAQTITPSTSDKTIASGRYLTGTQTIKGDANLKAENIAEGVSIFGVTGTHSGSGSGGGSGSIETCTLTVMAAAPCYVVYVTSDDTGNIHTEVTSMSVRHSELPVLCGGHISIIGNTTMATAGDVSVNGAELILQKNWSSIFRITAAVGGSASISIMMNT